jgi:hypothetical protein
MFISAVFYKQNMAEFGMLAFSGSTGSGGRVHPPPEAKNITFFLKELVLWQQRFL